MRLLDVRASHETVPDIKMTLKTCTERRKALSYIYVSILLNALENIDLLFGIEFEIPV